EPGLHLVALCGFSVPHLDHTRRSADFALALLRTIDHLKNLYNSPLQATLVLASGSMTAAMINSGQLAVKLWGEAPQLAYRLKTVARPGQIVVSQSVYDRLHEFYLFERHTENSWTLQRPA
ncbi:MAG: adenylate/guanylate cyclase domain-containing protein, partial [Caldilinea sp.]